jgi:peptidoglycan/xylan/chitin deacetylase (PgdA/CDA1 family)
MPRESAERCRQEIIDNKRRLEEIASRPVRLFAYPSGDADDRVASQVREAGYSGAFTILPPRRSIPPDLRRFYLPRIGIYNAGQVTFRLKCAGVDTLRWKLGLLNGDMRMSMAYPGRRRERA